VGFNMSWLFVDNIDRKTLCRALDLGPTDETPDPSDIGTSYVPLAGADVKSGWYAVFAKYALVMDALMATSPARLERMPARSRCVACVVLEHAMISYAGLWQGGRSVWQIRHDGGDHLDASGQLPPEFPAIRDLAAAKQRDRQPGPWGVDYLFDVPIATGATLTDYRHDRVVAPDLFMDLRTLVPVNGNVLTRLSQPPKWWQLTSSIEYE
jgi:hypothetical protein